MKTITKTELKYRVNGTGSHFFERSSMRFFGDTMRNYGVKISTIKVNEILSNGLSLPVEKKAYELYRKHAVKHGLHDSSYFDMVTFEKIGGVSK